MFCPKCGNELKPGTKFCNKCGASQEVPSSRESVRMKPNTGKRPDGGKTSDAGKNPPKGSGKKKGKGCLITVIVFLIVAVLLGAGGFAGYKLGLFDSLLNQKTEETATDNSKKDKKNSRDKDDDEEDEDDDTGTDKKKNQKKDEDEEEDDDNDNEVTTDRSAEAEKSEAGNTETKEQERVKLSELIGGTSASAETAPPAAETTEAMTPVSMPTEAETAAPAEASTELPSGTLPGDGSYILPDSSSRRLTEADLAGLNKDQLKIARNEIYARHGRMFNSEELQFYFNSKSWYHGTISPSAFSEDLLSQVEKDNVQLIIKKEESMP